MDFTVNFGSMNLLTVFVATLAANLLGGLWYSPMMFGNFWRTAAGLGEPAESMSNPTGTFISGFVMQLIAASMLAALLGPNQGALVGAQFGALLAIAFVFTAVGMFNLFERRPLALVFVNSGYSVAALTCMGAIIGAWG